MNTFTMPAADGLPLFVRQWLPVGKPRGVVQIVHGMSEHGGRYEGVAQSLNEAGIAVYAQDQRGHGVTGPELGYAGEGTDFATLVGDVGVVQRRLASDLPGVPIVLFGHSMGSFVARQFSGSHGDSLCGLVLSGAYEESRWLASSGSLLARLERMRLDPRGHSSLIQSLTIGGFNKRFAPARTEFDWISRDPAEVDRYIADPSCGFRVSIQFWIDLLDALGAGLSTPPPALPVCLLTGECDAVCAPDPGAKKLAAAFRSGGTTRLVHYVYPKARHELFREPMRDDVTSDLLSFLDSVL